MASALKNFVVKHFGGLPSKDAWKWWLRVNPTSPNSFPLASEYRKVAPGSQPTPNLDFPAKISSNRYFERDLRRQFPQTVVYTHSDLEKVDFVKVPVLNERYQYQKTDTHDPTGSAANPHFSIRMVK